MTQTQRGQLKRDDSNVPLGWKYEHIELAAPTTTVIKNSPGVLHTVVINKPTANGVVTIYDNTVASGSVIAIITIPASPQTDGPHTAIYDVAFNTGLTVVTSGAAEDITVTYI